MRWLPNALSLIRLGLVPVYVLLALALGRAAAEGVEPPRIRLAAVDVLLVAGLTDLLDGYVARRFDLVSRFGAIIDAVADKTTQVASLAVLTALGPPAFPRLPLWLLGSVLLRDLVLGGGWLTLRRGGRDAPVEHRWHGKAATALVFAVMIGATAGLDPMWIDPLVVAAALAALVSAVGYAARALGEGRPA